MKLSDAFAILRPQQYLKNLFIFLPLFFAFKITDVQSVWNAFLAFVSFSLVASSMYILNDIYDAKEDREHHFKKNRPIASGAVSAKAGAIMMLFTLALGLSSMAFFNIKAIPVTLIYIILNIAYTLRLKNISIVDITIISTGFVIRLFVGSFATAIPLSVWIVVNTFLLAMFLSLAKRRDDLIIFLETGQKLRRSLAGYNLELLNGSMFMMAGITILTYIMYTVSDKVTTYFHTDKLYLTAIFVLLGIMRYLQITLLEKKSGCPTEVLIKDRFIQFCITGWILVFMFLIYAQHNA